MEMQDYNKDLSSRIAIKYLLRKQNSDDKRFLLPETKNINKTNSQSRLKTFSEIMNHTYEGN
jgi:hypothetical protein